MDQKEIAIYVKGSCRRCWRAKRLLRRRNYAFEVIDVSGDDGLRNWLVEATGTKTVPPAICRWAPGGRLRCYKGTR